MSGSNIQLDSTKNCMQSIANKRVICFFFFLISLANYEYYIIICLTFRITNKAIGTNRLHLQA